MGTPKKAIIILLAVIVLSLGHYGIADAAETNKAAKDTSEIKGSWGEFELFKTESENRDLLTDLLQPITQTKVYEGNYDLFKAKSLSWDLLATSEQPPAKSGQGHGSLAEQATDPTAPLIQFRIENSFVPESFDSSGYSNIFQVQPVIPWKAPWGQLMITRPTIPIALTPDPDGPVNETCGLGDIDLLHIFIIEKDWGALGLGFNAVFPTATDERLGGGKWQAGPAGLVVYKKIPKWQLGALVYNNWSYETNRHGAENVNKMFIQWVANYHYKPGWYVGAGDLPWTFNWKNGKQDFPLSAKWGHTTKIGKQPVDMALQPFYKVAHEGPSGEWGIKFTFTFLFPE